MVEVTINVLRSDNLEDTKEFTSVRLPGVPCVGETIIVKGAAFEIRAASWLVVGDERKGEDVDISLACYETSRGYDFPIF